MPSDEVLVGVVRKPFGVGGAVYVHPDPDLPHDFPPGSTYHVEGRGTLTVEASWLHGTRRVVQFAEVGDRTAAEALRDTHLRVPRASLEVDEDAYWVDDLVGREVRTPGGEVVGVIEGVQDGHAHDYLVVARTDGGDALVPFVADLVELDDEAVIVTALPGLLDDDAEL